MEIKWTNRALKNLESILDYIAKDNMDAAVRMRDFVVQKIEILRHYPNIWRICDVPWVRELVIHENYIIVYRVRGESVQILRLRHARMKF